MLALVLLLGAIPVAPAHAEGDCDVDSGECQIDDGGGGGGGGPGGGTKGKTVKAPPPPCSAFPSPAIIVLAAIPKLDLAPQVGPDWVGITCRNPDPSFRAWVPPREAGERLAWYLVDRVDLDPITIGVTPLATGPDVMGLVGLPVWLWADDPDPRTWGPVSARAGGVRLTAQVESVTWDMGDGTQSTCGQGTPWMPALGAVPSPTCGHTYLRQGDFTIRAHTHWVARWSGYGESGTIRLSLTARRAYQVGEIQVVVQRGGR